MTEKERERISLAVDLIVEGCVAACADYDRETLQAIADNPNYKEGWPGLMIREYLNVWQDIGERP